MKERPQPRPLRQEEQGIAGKPVFFTGLALVAIGVAAVFVMAEILRGEEQALSTDRVLRPQPSYHPTAIEQSRIEGRALGQDLRAAARNRLEHWSWVQRGKVVRLPIADAVDWLLDDAEHQQLRWPNDDQDAPAQTVGQADHEQPGGAP